MLTGQMFLTMAVCLALTIVLEGAAAYVLGVRTLHGQTTVLLANVMTNPLVVSLNILASQHFGQTGYYVSLVFLEAAAFLAEAFIYRRDPPCRRNPFLLSALLNCFSYFAGLVISLVLFK